MIACGTRAAPPAAPPPKPDYSYWDDDGCPKVLGADHPTFRHCRMECGVGGYPRGAESLEIELEGTQPPRITSVVAGREDRFPRFAARVGAIRRMLAHPECPSRPLQQLHR